MAQKCRLTFINLYAFSGCNHLTAPHFCGNAPEADNSIFGTRDDSFTVCRLADKSGWPEPGEYWNGYKTAIFEK